MHDKYLHDFIIVNCFIYLNFKCKQLGRPGQCMYMGMLWLHIVLLSRVNLEVEGWVTPAPVCQRGGGGDQSQLCGQLGTTHLSIHQFH